MWERERSFNLSFRVKITLNADAPIRTAGGMTRTQHLVIFEKWNLTQKSYAVRVASPAVRVTHPHSGLREEFRKSPSVVRMNSTRSAGQPHPHSVLSRFQEIEFNTIIHECGWTHPQCGSLTRTKYLANFSEFQINTCLNECGCTHPQCGSTHPHSAYKISKFWRGFDSYLIYLFRGTLIKL